MTDRLRIDGTKVQFHPHRIAQWLDGKNDWARAKSIYPIYMEVSPIGGCNHACRFCGVDYVLQSAKEAPWVPRIDWALYADRIGELGKLGLKSVMFAGAGEPMLHRDIDRLVFATVLVGVDAAFTTNGTILHRLSTVDLCKWIKVSINAGTRETYARVHRTSENDWDRVWRNVTDAVKRKGDCQIGVQMVLLPENQHEAQLLQQLCADAGVDYCVLKPYSQHKFSVTREYENFIPIIPEADARTVVRRAAIETTSIPYDKCHATPYLWAYWEANGDLYSCSAYLLDDRFKLGNLNEQTFNDIWHSEKRRQNWEYVRKHLDIKDCRVNCRMNATNVYLDELVRNEINANFI